jgi:uncharacterized protein YndB with AHSA1/START domain
MRDWNGFILRILVRATPDEVARAWLTSGGLSSWFLKTAEYFSDDQKIDATVLACGSDSFRWVWADDSEELGRVLEIEFPHRFRFTWYGERGWVEIRLSEVDGRTAVELEQFVDQAEEKDRIECYISCTSGWSFFLANLKSVLEGGLDLRETSHFVGKQVNV